MTLIAEDKRTLPSDDAATWYKDAVIYELRVRSFMDANGDGVGDFAGLTEKLDYLQDLGVTALWLLPFYPSPGRDDGYDIGDYYDVHPDVGTLDDFRAFLAEAHRRGLRVITELVVNHTSDAHPWFQRARRAPPGSPLRDFYVWSDTPEKYSETRIIFKDFEPSNWSWDPVAKQYYWHRFFNHQPDLNYDNPAVHDAIFEVVDFWLGMGVDGLRLDAVPYLFEREGTNCENLPETHDFLRKLRAHIDGRFGDRMLLAEANQWPEDAASYFGRGDECHMNFHFPIMPRLFMSIHMEDRFPIIDILDQTPKIPDNCQWATFLRNHDELTLEMVTDEERDYMYRAFAHDPTMRINLGIRRRLAPLVGNDRRSMELMNGLLFSLPGTPCLYYGDEIGMGDNVYLGDRNGVRTPMQWSADRNAGFSRANPQKLILPTIIDPEYHYESLNVEMQQSNPSSLLWWTKRLVALRKRYRAFGRGHLELLHPENPRILAFVRCIDDEVILVVANLSRYVEPVSLDLSKYKGKSPRELFGGKRFPAIGEAPYPLALGGRAFYWFSLQDPPSAAVDAKVRAYQVPTLAVEASDLDSLLDRHRDRLEGILTDYLPGRRWFAGGDRPLASLRIAEVLPLGEAFRILLVHAGFAEGEPQTYAVAVGLADARRAGELRTKSPDALIADVTVGGESGGALYDAIADASGAAQALEAVFRDARTKAGTGEIVSRLVGEPAPAPSGEPRFLGIDHDNATWGFDDRTVVKFLRLVSEGASPEAEIGEFLASRAAPVAGFVGALEYRPRRKEPITLATATRYVPNEGVAWLGARDDVRRFFDRVVSMRGERPPERPRGGWLGVREWASTEGRIVGPYLQMAALLGQRTGELHLALASGGEDKRFDLDPFTAMDQRSSYQSMRNVTGRVLRTLKHRLPELDPVAGGVARQVLGREGEIYRRFEPLLHHKLTAMRGRVHGNLHLAQALFTGRDFVFIDFEGDRRKPAVERLRKRTPIRDVASMIRSYEYAAFSRVYEDAVTRPEDRAEMLPWAELWTFAVSGTYLDGWLRAVGDSPIVPKDRTELELLVDAYVLRRALEELGLALEWRPTRAVIPLRGLITLLDMTP